MSLRVSPTFLIDIARGERTGTNVDHFALAVEDADLDELAASGLVPVEMGPADLLGLGAPDVASISVTRWQPC